MTHNEVSHNTPMLLKSGTCPSSLVPISLGIISLIEK